MEYTFTGNLTRDPDVIATGNSVDLQRWDGIVWQNVAGTLFLSDFQGDFDDAGTLSAGLYRLRARMGMNASPNQSLHGTYNYDFQVVPEPATMALAAPLLLVLKRRRKKA